MVSEWGDQPCELSLKVPVENLFQLCRQIS